MKDEYARVGVPMMPVVHGETETRRQILLYTLLLGADAAAGRVRLLRGLYAVAAAASAPLLSLAVRLHRRADRRSALRTYLFSLAYLAALFCAMVSTPGSRIAWRDGSRLARRNIRTAFVAGFHRRC